MFKFEIFVWLWASGRVVEIGVYSKVSGSSLGYDLKLRNSFQPDLGENIYSHSHEA